MRPALGLLACAFVLGCGGGAPSPSPAAIPRAEPAPAIDEDARGAPEGPATEAIAEADRHVARALEQVASVRQLVVKSAVRAEVLDRDKLLDRVREHVAKEVPREVIRAQGETLVALGLVPPGFDYEGAIFRLLESQLAGFYEPRAKAMYLAGDLAGEAATATLAHELVHALQDQHWDLGPRLAYEPGRGDEQSALHALAEGDATSAMMDALLSNRGLSALDLPNAAFSLEMEASVGAGEEMAEIPRVLRASLVSPYVDGLEFVHALRRQGGWAAVNAAWQSPPVTTEQLLHIEKFHSREPAEMLPAPPPPGDDWAAWHEDALGEQGLRIVFEEWAPRRIARVAAAGWGGDRATLFRQKTGDEQSFALLWHLRFDEGPKKKLDLESREAFDLLAQSTTGKRPKGDRLCVERSGLGPWAILRAGRDVIVAAGPYRHEGGVVEPRSDCARALRWAAEVAKAAR